ncbi:MAG: acylphosphatase [Planctomycetota bacterium]|nr:MAG: acylphosphatase [Planctomycetota bacterium]
MSEPAARVAHRARVHGRVQGVFFRASAREQAQRLGLVGWVRNLPDGTVEAYYEGAPAAVREMDRWLRQGPPLARVTAVDIEEREPEGMYDSFRIRH